MRLLMPVVLALALAAGGCGDNDDENATTPSANPQEAPQESAEPTEESASSGGGDVVEVRMKDIQFDPQQVTVRVGQTVRWTNEEEVQHDADAENGEFESELYGEGGTQEWTAEEPGTVEYICSVHPNMQGTITVEE